MIRALFDLVFLVGGVVLMVRAAGWLHDWPQAIFWLLTVEAFAAQIRRRGATQ